MKKVLIIDDDTDIRAALVAVLKNRYDVREAGSRKEGKKVLKEFTPDLIILDVMMEERDSGFELVRELKTDEQLKNIKILMSTNVDKEMQANFKQFAGDSSWLPVDDYVNKPIDLKRLLGKVEELIGV